MAEIQLRGLGIRSGTRPLVEEVDLDLRPGELLGVVGASGSGKSLSMKALLGLVPRELDVVARLRVPSPDGIVEPYAVSGRSRALRFRAIRGHVIGLLPQDAGRCLDPFRTVGAQLKRVGAGGHSDEAVRNALSNAGFPDPAAVNDRFPHELSGGMAQRAALASLLVMPCPFLICDEPTTGLDAAVQRGLMGTLSELARQGRGVVVVSHALRWLDRGADRIVVFSEGRLVEEAPGTHLQTEAGRSLLAAARASSTPGFPGSLSGAEDSP